MRAVRAATALVTALTLLAVASCTRINDAGSRTIQVLIAANASFPAKQQKWMADVARTYKAETGYTVQFRTFASISDEQQQLQAAVITGTGPDIFDLGTTFTPVAYSTGAIHTLTASDWRKLGGRDRFFGPQLAMAGPSPTQDVSVPLGMRPFALAYNTDMFAKAGIEGPPTTWTEFVQDARKLTDARHGVYGAATDPSDGADPWKYVWMFTLQNGGRLITDDAKTSKLGSPQVLDALQFWLGWYSKYHIVDPHSVTWKGPDALSAFSTGRSAMLTMTGPGAVPTLDQSKVKGHYKFAPMPVIPYGRTSRPANGLPAGTIVSGDNFSVAEYSTKKDAALKFIRLLTSTQEELNYWKLFGDIPTDRAALAAASARDPQTAALARAANQALPTTFTGAWAVLQIALGTAIAQCLPALSGGSFDRTATGDRLRQISTQVQASLDQQAKSKAKAGKR
jgi:multiple sugar transport system substrate-binding protein